MPWRGLEPPHHKVVNFESTVSTISPPRLFISRAEGFEPSNNETKTRGLTTWLHPNSNVTLDYI